MSDFERRLADALQSEAESAPKSIGLAAAARARANGRRRTRLVAASCTLTAAVIVSIALVAGNGAPGTEKTDLADDYGPTPGFRVETWHAVSVEVPNTWIYGSLSTWCLEDVPEPVTEVVGRPGDLVLHIGCGAPLHGYGLSFESDLDQGDLHQVSSGETFPRGAWVGTRLVGDVAVTVSAHSEDTARRILDSATASDGVDPNGCPVEDDSTAVGISDGLSICRYSVAGDLMQSERLVADDAASALAAVEAAAVIPYAPPCPAPSEGIPITRYVVMLSEDTRYEVVWEGARCPDRGVFIDARQRRELTADVLYWALSPGFNGGYDGDVPMPDDLRELSDIAGTGDDEPSWACAKPAHIIVDGMVGIATLEEAGKKFATGPGETFVESPSPEPGVAELLILDANGDIVRAITLMHGEDGWVPTVIERCS